MRRHLLPVLVGLALIGCNLLSGSSDLSVCAGATCDDGGSSTSTSSGGPPTATDGGSGDGSPPATCTDGAKRCEGRVLATCASSTWSTAPCAETCVDGACVPWPSCRATTGSTCGANNTSCCETKPVPGGTYNRRNVAEDPATISPFALDTYEVTVGRFRAFVNAGAGTEAMPPAAGAGAHPKIAGSGWQATWTTHLPATSVGLRFMLSGGTWTSDPGPNEEQPINNVPWHVAFAFCAWDGGRLPTYAEWDFAAAGGAEQRYYPWSVPAGSEEIASSNAAYNCRYSAPGYTCPPSNCSVGGASPCDATACTALMGTCVTPACYGCNESKDIAPVGRLPQGAGRYGHLDLGGNVAELVLDAFDKNWSGKLPNPCLDCALLMGPSPAGPGPGGSTAYSTFVVGGAWNDGAAVLRTSEYASSKFDDRSVDVGFRCARD